VKITDVKAVSIDLGPAANPWSDATYTNQRRIFGYVEVFTDEGVTGFCPSAANPLVVEENLKPMLVGENPLNIEGLWMRMWDGWRHPKMDDALTISKVDIALWDLLGKLMGQPSWRLLGGARPVVAAYAAGGMYHEGKDVAGLVDEMTGFVEDGFRHVKMKVGRLSVKEDLERVRAVRKAIGPDVELMIDGNHVWTVSEAILFARACQDERIFWLEEPVNPWDHRGCAEVARALDVPVATGENVSSRYAFRDMIDARAADIIQADAIICGGLTEWRRIAAYAAAHNLPVAPHGNAHVGAVCVASAPNGMIVEVGYYGGRRPTQPQVVAPIEVRDGFIHLTEEPGIGWQIDRDVIRRNLEGR
jgi:L-alanine-DL-glutamate epimerase-like enolase superfamily enzyme